MSHMFFSLCSTVLNACFKNITTCMHGFGKFFPWGVGCDGYTCIYYRCLPGGGGGLKHIFGNFSM